MSAPAATPDTIVLIHGFWVTPRSWEHWIAHYEARGFRVLAPAYPGFEVEVEALNADPTPIEAVTVPQIIDAPRGGRRRARAAADPDRPLGRRRVHPDPARPRPRRRRRRDQLGADRGRQGRPALADPGDVPGPQEPGQPPPRRSASRSSSGTTRSRTRSARRSRCALYERYHIPASGRDLLGQRARQHPPRQGRHWVDYAQRRPRAAAVHLRQRGPPHAAEDPAVQRQALHVGHGHRGQGVRGPAPAARRRRAGRRSPTTPSTGRSRTRRSRAPRDRRPRLTASRTSAARRSSSRSPVWRLLTDPTFDPPGRRYRFGWGTASRKLAGPAIAADELGPIDAVLLTHDHHDDNLDPAGRALLPSAGAVVTTVVRRPSAWAAARAACAPWETTRLERPGRDRARGHGDAVPPRAAAQPPDRRRRRRLRAALGGRSSTARCGSRATPSSTTACARSPTG